MTSAYTKTVLDIAAEVEAAEMNIKNEILAAADAGDCARITDIVTRWLGTPPAEVLNGLASCGDLEVTQDEHPGAGGGSTQR
jgi:hypothetical protein